MLNEEGRMVVARRENGRVADQQRLNTVEAAWLRPNDALRLKLARQWGLGIIVKDRRMDAESVGQLGQNSDGRVAFAPFDPPQMPHGETGFASQRLLTQTALLAESPDIRAHDLFPIHPADGVDMTVSAPRTLMSYLVAGENMMVAVDAATPARGKPQTSR